MTIHSTYENAALALETAKLDVAADFGEDAVDAAFSDLVHVVAADCSPEVRAELLRRNGVEERSTGFPKPPPYPTECPYCRGTGGGTYNDCAACGGNGVI